MKLHVTLREVSIVRILVILSLCCAMSSASAEIYHWIDANGKQVYGDQPPDNARSVQAVELPILTVAESFKGKPKPAEAQATANQAPTTETTARSPASPGQSSKPAAEPTAATVYESFRILVPGDDAVLRSSNGEVKIKIALQPALQQGHGIVVYVDGRQVGETTDDSINVVGIERGEHSVFAVLHDAQDAILGNTEAVNFTMMRNSVVSRAN